MNQPSSSEGTNPVGRLVTPNQVATSKPTKTNAVKAAFRSSPVTSAVYFVVDESMIRLKRPNKPFFLSLDGRSSMPQSAGLSVSAFNEEKRVATEMVMANGR